MENLKDNFDKINSKFLSNRDNYKKKIEKWLDKGKLEFHKTASTLLEKADFLSKEIEQGFISTVEGRSDKSLLKKRIRSFKRVVKKLNDITKPIWRQWIEAIVFAGSFVFILRTYVFGLYHVPTGSAEPTILVGDRLWGNKMSYYFNSVKRGDSVIFDNPEFVFDRSSKLNYFWQKFIGFPIPILGLSAGPDNWVKRVIAVPGDILEGRVEDGKTVIYRNGKKVDETAFVNPYPLIRLVKVTGFIPFSNIGPINIPSFLRKVVKTVDYTYDQTKTYDNQPFYNMNESQVVKKSDHTPLLTKAYTPCFEYDYRNGFIKKSVDNFGPIRIPDGKYWVMGDSRKNSRDSRYWGFLDESLIHGKASFVIYSVDSEEPLWIFELIKHPIDFWFKSIRWNRFLKWIK